MTVDESNLLGLPSVTSSELLATLFPFDDVQPANQSEVQQDLCARLVWSQLVEPGDQLAGQLVAELGAAVSLSALRGSGGISAAESRLWRLLQQSESSLCAIGREDATRSVLRSGVERWVQRDNNAKLVRDLKTWQQLGGWIISPKSSNWPEQLSDLGFAAPICLWGRGRAEALASTNQFVSVVGSRNTTSYGAWITRELSSRLGDEGYCVVSGGAYGIDSFAHQAVVELAQSKADGTETPMTIAVMAGGGDRLYPVGNTQLLRQVLKYGCVISELPPGNAPTKWRFLQRNRLIAALGQTVVVIEMAYRSGALNTVHHALQIGRRVVAVPGSILSPTSQGCNQVIDEGKAEIATSFDNLLLLAKGQTAAPQNAFELTALQTRVLDALSGQPSASSRISQKSGSTANETNEALAELELLGYATRLAGKWKRSEGVQVTDSAAKVVV